MADLKTTQFLPFIGILTLIGGCATLSPAPPPQAFVRAPELSTPPAPSSDHPSTLSYGMVTGRVKKGVTTQQEIVELFGGPSTMTTDKDGTEVWMYDKTSSTVSGNYAQSVMASFLGIPLVTGASSANAAAQSQSAQSSQGTSTLTRSVKTITFIIKFNEDKTVKDYAVRQASY
jgi:outer membrane protein assembly factor BamE (lipoprotein component of BamABCDE complex)